MQVKLLDKRRCKFVTGLIFLLFCSHSVQSQSRWWMTCTHNRGYFSHWQHRILLTSIARILLQLSKLYCQNIFNTASTPMLRYIYGCQHCIARLLLALPKLHCQDTFNTISTEILGFIANYPHLILRIILTLPYCIVRICLTLTTLFYDNTFNTGNTALPGHIYRY